MKLVIKYDQNTKLFRQELNYELLLAFVRLEFALPIQDIQITFTDQEGDNITIASDEDIQILKSYFNGKEYVKINVKVIPKPETLVIKPIQPQQQNDEDSKPKKTKNNSKSKKQKVQGGKDKQEKAVKEQSKNNFSSIQQIKKLLNLAVVQLVDQRVKALIPCIQEQIHNPAKKDQSSAEIVHEGYECGLCLSKPIKGIRYECPTCQSFTICSRCQEKAEHEHNLLKIRRAEEKAEKESSYIDKICQLLMEQQQQKRKKREENQELKKKEKQQKRQLKLKLSNAQRTLHCLFGNQTSSYYAFVSKHKTSSLQQIVKSYVEANNIPADQFKEKLINLQASRLSKMLKRSTNQFKQLVRQHLDFDLNVILKAMQKQGFEIKPSKQQKLNKKSSKKAVKAQKMEKEEKAEKIEKVEKMEEMEKPVQEKKEAKQQIKPQLVEQLNPRKLSSKIEGKSQLKGEKLQTLNLMIQFFGAAHQAQYVKFIQAHQTQGKEQILQNWANKFSLIHE